MNTSIKSALSGEQYLDVPEVSDLSARAPQPLSLKAGGDASALDLRDDSRRRDLGAASETYLLRHHFPEPILDRYEALFAHLLHEPAISPEGSRRLEWRGLRSVHVT